MAFREIREPVAVDISRCYAIVKDSSTNYRQCKHAVNVDNNLYCHVHKKGLLKCGSIYSIYNTEKDIQWIGRMEEYIYNIRKHETPCLEYYFKIVQLYQHLKSTSIVWKNNDDVSIFVQSLLPFFEITNQNNPQWEPLDLSIFETAYIYEFDIENENLWCFECDTLKKAIQFYDNDDVFLGSCFNCHSAVRNECTVCFDLVLHHEFTQTPCCSNNLCKNCWIKHEKFGNNYEIENINPMNGDIVYEQCHKQLQCMFCRAELPNYVDYLLELISQK